MQKDDGSCLCQILCIILYHWAANICELVFCVQEQAGEEISPVITILQPCYTELSDP